MFFFYLKIWGSLNFANITFVLVIEDKQTTGHLILNSTYCKFSPECTFLFVRKFNGKEKVIRILDKLGFLKYSRKVKIFSALKIVCLLSFLNNPFSCRLRSNSSRGHKEMSSTFCCSIAPSHINPNAEEGERVRGLSQLIYLSTWSPNKLWRSNSIFNL